MTLLIIAGALATLKKLIHYERRLVHGKPALRSGTAGREQVRRGRAGRLQPRFLMF
ncbi:hypothetical protein [Nitrospira moscoviensis]|uniref:hypothetical protein n=1 Tax=Nitrospira moscoviensis TaxID=42253 RepID=UPI000A97AAD0|nr:hypothetical protein [Nitrospira moscoviensis]